LSVKDFLKALTNRNPETYSTPVWFVDQKNKIYLLPVSGSDTNWYKNIRVKPNVTLTVDKKALQVEAKPMDEPNRVKEVINMFGAKYGADEIERWYTKLDVAVEIPPTLKIPRLPMDALHHIRARYRINVEAGIHTIKFQC